MIPFLLKWEGIFDFTMGCWGRRERGFGFRMGRQKSVWKLGMTGWVLFFSSFNIGWVGLAGFNDPTVSVENPKNPTQLLDDLGFLSYD